MNRQKGFTIIELIVVIAIIAVMAAIVLVNVNGFMNKGKDSAAMMNLNTLQNKFILFKSGTLDNHIGQSDYLASNPGDFSTINNCGGGWPDILGGPCKALVASNMGYVLTIHYGDGTLPDNDYTKWCASVPLKADTTKSYCVDYTGKKIKGAGETCASGVCP